MDKSITQYCNMCKDFAGFYCNGCNKTYCEHHADEHRQAFYDQLDWLTVDHDDLFHTLNNTSTITQTSHSSRKIIDKWEEDSIKYIRTTANEARRSLMNAINNHINDVKEKLKLITDKLNQIYEENELFDERYIKKLAKQLTNLKQEYTSTPTFTVRIHGNKPVVMPIIKIQPDPIIIENSSNEQQQQQNSFGLIPIKPTNIQNDSSSNKPSPRTSIDNNINPDDRFYSNSDHIKILDNGQRILHDSTNLDGSIRGHHEYSSGEHKLFFRIEHMTSDEWIFFGIISKHSSLTSKSYIDSSAYGWAGYNNVYINGKSMPILNGYINEMKINDFVELTIDCDQQTLFLWHSQQTYKYKLPVDIRTCPFPWQLLISCHNANDSVRILPSSMRLMIKREQDKLNHNMKIKDIRFQNDNDYIPIHWGIHAASTVR